MKYTSSLFIALTGLCALGSHAENIENPFEHSLLKLNGKTLELVTANHEIKRVELDGVDADKLQWLAKNGLQAELQSKIALEPSVHQLNLVYFLGNDREPIEGYEERLSALMLLGQQYYGKEMLRNGFGARSFGLDMKSADKVNIILYRAKGKATDYPYENGGGWKAAQEVNAYLDAQGLRKSQHTLIIFPTWYDEKNTDMSPGGVPFYGLGKTCCALDYAHFDIKHFGQNTPQGHLLTKWYGGMIHELGHGLNLPHNHASVSDEKNMGTALMGAGNYTFGLKPTFITAGSCAILDACEVFATDPEQTYYKTPLQLEIEHMRVDITENEVVIEGNYVSDTQINSLNVYIEEPPFAVNQDYEANCFTTSLKAKEGKIAIRIPRAEINGINGNLVQVRLMFISQSGQLIFRPFNFKMDALEPQTVSKQKL